MGAYGKGAISSDPGRGTDETTEVNGKKLQHSVVSAPKKWHHGSHKGCTSFDVKSNAPFRSGAEICDGKYHDDGVIVGCKSRQ